MDFYLNLITKWFWRGCSSAVILTQYSLINEDELNENSEQVSVVVTSGHLPSDFGMLMTQLCKIMLG